MCEGKTDGAILTSAAGIVCSAAATAGLVDAGVEHFSGGNRDLSWGRGWEGLRG